MRLPGTVRAVSALGLALAALVAGSGAARASIMKYLTIEELARESSLVVRAKITGQSIHWTANHEGIYTEVRAVVVGPIKSAGVPAPAGRRLTIIQAGGEIDGVSLDWTGRPTFQDGEDLVLFLQPYDDNAPSDERLLIVGGKQGRMRVIQDPTGKSPMMVQRDLTGVLEAPGISGDVPKGPAPRRDLIKLEDLRKQVEAAGGGAR